MLTVRYSELEAFRRCPRSWYLRWYLNRAPKAEAYSTNLLEGSATHAGIESYNRGSTPEEGLLSWLSGWNEFLPEEETDSREAVASAAQMAGIYLEAFPDWSENEGLLDVGKEVLGIELPVHVRLECGVTLTGSIDRLVRDVTLGGIVVEDYKTAADFRDKPVQANAQLLTYAIAVASVYEEPVVGGRHIRIKKNKRTSMAKPPFYDVADLIYTEEQLRKHTIHTNVWASRLAKTREQLDQQGSDEGRDFAADRIAPPSPSFHCTSPKCQFIEVCGLMDDGSDWRSHLDEFYPEVATAISGE